ncbi:MAG TPA: hypothetical protein VGN88_11140 [Phycisphaerae bacterium]|jgi:hypothetical protein
MVMQTAWNFVVVFITQVPWVIIALAALLGLRKAARKVPPLVQAAGAAGYFVVAMARWVVFTIILRHVDFSPDMYSATQTIFTFLLVVCLMVFAGGYVCERLLGRKAERPGV